MSLIGTLDLYELMVNSVAGSILLSILIVAIILLVAGIMGRLSFESLLVIISYYLVVMAIGYFGAIAAILVLIIVLWYFISGIVNWFNNVRV